MITHARQQLERAPDLQRPIDAWCQRLAASLETMNPPGRVSPIGRILHVADGVATVAGLPDTQFNELLRFPNDVFGLVFNLDADRIGCVLLGPDEHLSAGDRVEPSGMVASVPVGDGLLGRVVDALGEPIDGAGALDTDQRLPVEQDAPAILERAAVKQQLLTGIKAVDALIPIGRGQRELILGDRATGKTAVAVDTILSQKRSDIICIYVAIGQKSASVKTVAQDLRNHDALDTAIIVSADADDPPGLQYLAPYSATAMGEHFMRQGKDVLLVYDDLTRHARAYREISLLLRRPPGREAYPGDIFFIHSRLLERATHLNDDAGGGSLTALPIVETQAKNLSAYIPTNLISITDGQILLDPDLFAKGIKPAIDVGKSVSRVGGKTQLPAIRSLAEDLRLQYAQFEELELFTRFGATVEKETRAKIERGKRIRELLKQIRLRPLSAVQQVAILLSVKEDIVDAVPLGAMRDFAAAVQQQAHDELGDLDEQIVSTDGLFDEAHQQLAQLVRLIADSFGEEEDDSAAHNNDGES